MYRCNSRNTTTSGAIETAAATNSSCRLRFCAVVNVDRATCTVHASWSCPITSGHRNAFQAPMKTIVPTAAKTGRALGTTMRQYVRQ